MPMNPLPPWIPRNTDNMNNLIGMMLMGGGASGGGGGVGGGGVGGGGGGGGGGGNTMLTGATGMTGIANNLGSIGGGQNPFSAISNWWGNTPVGGAINNANNALAAAQSGIGQGINPAAPSPWEVMNTGPAWSSGPLGGVSPGQASQPGYLAAYGGGTVGGGSSDLGNIRGIPIGPMPSFGRDAPGGRSFWDWIQSFFR